MSVVILGVPWSSRAPILLCLQPNLIQVSSGSNTSDVKALAGVWKRQYSKSVCWLGERQQAEADTRAAAQVCDESLTSYTHSGRNTTYN